MGSVAKKGLKQYLVQLKRHPLRTKVITAGVLPAVSDIMAQKLSGIQKLQLKRLLLKMVVLEQVTMSPWNNMMFMIYYGLVIEGRPWIHVKSKINKEFPSVQNRWWSDMKWLFLGNISESKRARSMKSCWC